MLPVEFYESAEAELLDAISFYEEKETGLGASFREAVEHAVDALRERPFAYPVIAGSSVRRILTSRFPFVIVFRVEETKIVVVSVFHTSRNPIVWSGRID